ncbi:hypothetical protein SDC9_123397 [bioreactor metagenome]|uniref:Uncharacterized protein n=1 Tax=bioreactor metagenome TaxID=1076179 RepID=A0A645CHJ8_9ZZZZ
MDAMLKGVGRSVFPEVNIQPCHHLPVVLVAWSTELCPLQRERCHSDQVVVGCEMIGDFPEPR